MALPALVAIGLPLTAGATAGAFGQPPAGAPALSPASASGLPQAGAPALSPAAASGLQRAAASALSRTGRSDRIPGNAVGRGARARPGPGMTLRGARVTPRRAYFDGSEPVRIRFRFLARRRVDVIVRAIRVRTHNTVRRWVRPGLAPRRRHELRWDGLRRDRTAAPSGRYAIRIGHRGERGPIVGKVRILDHAFPIAGPYTYGDRFGVPRSGGRVHEGQDLPSPCGTPIVAARGGRVQARGYSHSLYGHWVLIDARATRADHFYSHLAAPARVRDGDRVRTGERIGSVGKTGNARSEFCQLHFELWPHGYRRDSPADPLAELKRWAR